MAKMIIQYIMTDMKLTHLVKNYKCGANFAISQLKVYFPNLVLYARSSTAGSRGTFRAMPPKAQKWPFCPQNTQKLGFGAYPRSTFSWKRVNFSVEHTPPAQQLLGPRSRFRNQVCPPKNGWLNPTNRSPAIKITYQTKTSWTPIGKSLPRSKSRSNNSEVSCFQILLFLKHLFVMSSQVYTMKVANLPWLVHIR